MDAVVFLGELFFEMGMETRPRNRYVSQQLIAISYGFFRQAEDVNGVQRSKGQLDLFLDDQIENISSEFAREKLPPMKEMLESDFAKKTLSTEKGARYLLNELKEGYQHVIDEMIDYQEKKSAEPGTLIGRLYYDIGLDVIPRHKMVGRAVIKIAYGFFRDAEDVEGMTRCRQYLGEELDQFIKNKSFEDASSRLSDFRKVLENSDLTRRLMQDPDGIKLVEANLRTHLRKNVEDLIRYAGEEGL